MSVHLLPRPAAEPDPDIIKTLEDLLERARKGEIESLAYAIQITNSKVRTGTAMSADGNLLTLLAALQCLSYRITKRIEEL